jgi:hypothetical protein
MSQEHLLNTNILGLLYTISEYDKSTFVFNFTILKHWCF